MYALFHAILRILFPSPALARWMTRVATWMDGVEALLSDPENLRDLQTREGRLKLESGIALVEDWINFLTNARAAELLGHRYAYIQRDGRIWAPSGPRSWASLMQRYKRLWSSLANIERMAHRRANRIRREHDANPLNIAGAMMIIRDQHDDRALIIMREVLHRLWRGRRHARICAHDGGGRASARGPPASTHSAISRAHHLALTCEIAPARLPQSLPRRLLKTSGDPLAKSTKREHNREQERSKNMNGAVNFCGANGSSYKFERFGAEQDWAKVAGVVLFAAPEGKSWRVIRVADQGGVEGDVATFWRWREARRYGATAIFIRRNADITARRREAADLAQGLDPVFASGSELAREPELMAA